MLPLLGVRQVLAGCGGGDDVALAKREIEALERFEDLYKVSAVEGLLSFARDQQPIPEGLNTAVAWIYEQRFARKDGPGRAVYSAIRGASPFNRCPLCLHNSVQALDHYLPKKSFPALAITPVNLVPICDACNRKKSTYVAVAVTELPFHAYYETLNQSAWLAAEVVESPTAPLIFSVKRDTGWSDEMAARVDLHFERLGLGELFSDNAAAELNGVSTRLDEIADAGTPADVRDYMLDLARTYGKSPVMIWRAVAFAAWANSDWFCVGGYREREMAA
jgi:hypothetical protein